MISAEDATTVGCFVAVSIGIFLPIALVGLFTSANKQMKEKMKEKVASSEAVDMTPPALQPQLAQPVVVEQKVSAAPVVEAVVNEVSSTKKDEQVSKGKTFLATDRRAWWWHGVANLAKKGQPSAIRWTESGRLAMAESRRDAFVAAAKAEAAKERKQLAARKRRWQEAERRRQDNAQLAAEEAALEQMLRDEGFAV